MAKRQPKELKRPPVPIAGEDYTLNIPSPHLSFSSIRMYLNCARQYWYAYVGERRRWTKSEQAMGDAMDVAISAQLRIQAAPPKKAIIPLDLMRKQFNKRAKEVSAYPKSQRDLDLDILMDLWDSIQPFLRRCTPAEYDGKPAIQLEVNQVICGVPIKCIVDYVDESRGIIDWKVAKDARWYRPDSSLQLDIDRYLLPDETQASYVVLSKKDRRTIVTNPVSLERKQIEAHVEATVSGVARAISAGAFPRCEPSNSLCDSKWCDFWDECRG